MNIKRYLKKKSPLPILALVFPSISAAITVLLAAFILYAGFMGYTVKLYLLIAVLSFILMATLPVCGSAGLLCSILALRKLGRKKRIIAAIVWNGITLALGIVLLCIYFS